MQFNRGHHFTRTDNGISFRRFDDNAANKGISVALAEVL
jgi:hypothetical protein